jgi:DNA end-binding protein Ku
VNVPIRLFPSVSEKRVRFHLVHDADGARIREKRVCSKDGKEVPYEHVVRGFEVSKGELVVFQKDELEKVASEATHACEIEAFVDLASIDPVFFDSSYYASPEKSSVKAYQLLAAAMRKTEKVGIGRIVLRTKQSLAAVRATDTGLVLSTLHFADEVRSGKDLEGLPPASARALPEKEMKMAEQLIGTLTQDFEPERYRDTYRDRVMELVRQKAEGHELVAQPWEQPATPAVDLVKALQESLAASQSGERQRPTRAPRRALPGGARRARRRHG